MSIGEVLAEARRRAGLTVTQVSEQTRIRATIIRAMEQDDYSACGGDFYARGDIRAIARAVGTDPVPLVAEYDAFLGSADEDTAVDAFPPATPIRIPGRDGRHRLAIPSAVVLAGAVLAGVAIIGYHLISGSPAPGPAAPRHAGAGAAPAVHHRGRHATARPVPTATRTSTAASPSPAPPRPLAAASATAFGPGGPGQGDNPQLAALAIDGNPATAWLTDWYASARLGNLQAGTGLLLDLGQPVTIASAQLTLGRTAGADLQLRVGSTPALARLRPVATASNAGGVVRLRVARPASGRYLLIWFTRLPSDNAGRFQASLYNVQVEGTR